MFSFARSRPAVVARRLGLLALAIAVLGAALLLAAGGPAAAQAKNAEVDGTAANKWEPANVTIPVGGTVTFKVAGGATHPVGSGSSPPTTDKKFDTSACVLAKMTKVGDSCTVKFPKAGTYPFFCEVHWSLGMTGTITVGSGGGAAPASTAAGGGGTPVVTAPSAAPPTAPSKPGVFWLGYGLLALGAVLALAAIVGYLRFAPGFRRGGR